MDLLEKLKFCHGSEMGVCRNFSRGGEAQLIDPCIAPSFNTISVYRSFIKKIQIIRTGSIENSLNLLHTAQSLIDKRKTFKLIKPKNQPWGFSFPCTLIKNQRSPLPLTTSPPSQPATTELEKISQRKSSASFPFTCLNF